MEKLVTIKFGPGSLEAGFSIILQIGDGQGWPAVEMMGTLPPAPTLQHTYQRWQVAYRQLGQPYRLEARKQGFAKHVSRVADCREVAQQLSQQFNQWLKSEPFRPLHDKLLEKLSPTDTIRFVVQTQQTEVQRLPWSAWEMCDRYPKAEMALGAPSFEQVHQLPTSRQTVRVLAIVGDSQGIDVKTDQALLNHLPNAEVVVLDQPERAVLNTRLWDPQGWDIIFFAGHSSSQSISDTESVGKLFINPTDSLTIAELKLALKKSLQRGLQIAVFNSCDGLGLAQALAELHIPQVLVMREPIPDLVAQEFLKSFLAAFARGESLYLSVREAREKLHGLEEKYPCATWLPAIFQNPAISPPSWSNLPPAPKSSPVVPPPPPKRRRRAILLLSLVVGVGVLALRQLGVLQPLEIGAYDRFMSWRPEEGTDPRIVVVTVTEADVQQQDPEQRRGSLSDSALSALLTKLEPMQPRIIGLDIYRDFSVRADQPQLAQQMANNENLIAVCKVSDEETSGIAPPPEITDTHIGFSDFVSDSDQMIRRQLVALTPEPASACQASYGFSTLVALHYLSAEDVSISATPDGALKIDDVVFTPLETNFGGYQGISAGGHQIMLNYRSLSDPTMITESVTLADVLENRVEAAAIRDRIVLIGTTARSFGDFWPIPPVLRDAEADELAGVFMQAQMTSQILSTVLDGRSLIKTWSQGMEVAWILIWTVLSGGLICCFWALPFRSTTLVKAFLALVTAELALFVVSWQLLGQWGYWVPWVPSAIAAALVIGTTPFLTMLLFRQTNELIRLNHPCSTSNDTGY